MFNTKLFIVGVLIIGMLCAGLYFYNDSKQDVKYCDSLNIQAGYSGEPICYETPTKIYTPQNLEVKR